MRHTPASPRSREHKTSVHIDTAASQSSTCGEDSWRLQGAKYDLKCGLTRGSKRDVGCWLHWLMLQLLGLLTFFGHIPTSPLLYGIMSCTKRPSALQTSQMRLQPRSTVCGIWGSKRPHTEIAFAQGWNWMGAHRVLERRAHSLTAHCRFSSVTLQRALAQGDSTATP